MIRFLAFVFSLMSIGIVIGLGAIAGVVAYYGRDLPSYETLQNYHPPLVTRVYARDGAPIAEYLKERRIFVPIDEFPDLMKHAVIAAEDKNFYTHPGFDLTGIVSAILTKLQGGRMRGASTLTQQVVKNFLLSSDVELERKIKEIILATRIEQVMTKDQILELYLNEFELGQRAHGFAAASENYFGKPIDELLPQEAAFLAALLKGPTDLNPIRHPERALDRRNYVLGRMLAEGYLTEEQAEIALASPLETIIDGKIDSELPDIPPANYFTEEIRRQLIASLGAEQVLGGGLTVRATINQRYQALAGDALRGRLESWDRERGGWRGAVGLVDPAKLGTEASWRAALSDLSALPRDIPGWRPAVVLLVGDNAARVGIEGVPEDKDGHYLTIKDMSWARPKLSDDALGKTPKRPADVLAVGDVVFVTALTDTEGKFEQWSLRQIPELEGAFMAMDALTGRVLAMVGGFSHQTSNFNRATLARRQPGSSFKPFVYAAALDSGYTPATVILDAPIVVDTGSAELWRPQNASKKFYGPSPMRLGIEQSRNVMTVRLAQEIGMDKVADYAERFGVYKDMPHHLSYALGAGETTLYQMVSAYAVFANGGLGVTPTLVDRVQDRYGETIWRQEARRCDDCAGPIVGDPATALEPWARPNSARVMDAVTAYQLTSMMQGVTSRGTARQLQSLGIPLAGKTGTTNDARDVWFIGFTPDIVAGCFIGYDNPRPMGRGAAGGTLCAPVFETFMKVAKNDRPVTDFQVPAEAVAVKVDRFSGARLADDATGDNVVVEAFHPEDVPRIGEFTGDGVIGGDGGMGMMTDGGDLPMQATEPAPEPTRAADGASPGRPQPPRPPVAAGFSAGGLY
ncbi:MAG: penicillin-binding protein 1A [Paracoccaceae bacterium]|jgi:penicillin-binding protein 1A